MTQDDLIEAVGNYIRENGGMTAAYGWYVGVASDPQRRLFRNHRVNKRDGAWIYGEAETDSAARKVEQSLLERGCQGGSVAENPAARSVYAYRITLYTQEDLFTQDDLVTQEARQALEALQALESLQAQETLKAQEARQALEALGPRTALEALEALQALETLQAQETLKAREARQALEPLYTQVDTG